MLFNKTNVDKITTNKAFIGFVNTILKRYAIEIEYNRIQIKKNQIIISHHYYILKIIDDYKFII